MKSEINSGILFMNHKKVIFKNHFDNLHKAEKVAIIGILNDASRLASSIASYQHWFEEK